MLYAGADKKEYQAISNQIYQSNIKNLTTFSTMATIGLLVLILGSFFSSDLAQSRNTYVICIAVTVAISLLSENLGHKSKTAGMILVYIFVELLLMFGIVLGTIVEPNQASVSFGILLFAAPLLFTDTPLRMISVCLINIVIYFVMAYNTQSADMLSFNASVIVPYGILSFAVCTFMMMVKTERYIFENRNRILSESDQLTGILNRRSYERQISILRNNGYDDRLKICAFDVNGLKKINDSIGHHAGDELIKAAADIITEVFGEYGECYRTGGDEFMAVITNDSPDNEELIRKLNEKAAAHKGEYINGISISAGIESPLAGDTIDLIMTRADKAMYAAKAEYYKNSGIDRRNR